MRGGARPRDAETCWLIRSDSLSWLCWKLWLPPERLAFVLHDMFDMPFEEIAPIVERSPDAAPQLASRARRRVRGNRPVPSSDFTRQREVIDAFLAASRRR